MGGKEGTRDNVHPKTIQIHLVTSLKGPQELISSKEKVLSTEPLMTFPSLSLFISSAVLWKSHGVGTRRGSRVRVLKTTGIHLRFLLPGRE